MTAIVSGKAGALVMWERGDGALNFVTADAGRCGTCRAMRTFFALRAGRTQCVVCDAPRIAPLLRRVRAEVESLRRELLDDGGWVEREQDMTEHTAMIPSRLSLAHTVIASLRDSEGEL